jgi:Tfp pilus assembly protein PilX
MIWGQLILDSRQDGAGCAPSTVRAGEEPSDRGVALVITLLLLFLLSVIGLAAVLSASSDLLINGYYSNYRGSFYAADSGINIARQAMYNQLNSSFSTDFAPFQSPPPTDIAGLASTVRANLVKNYGGGGPCPINPPALANSTTCYLNAGTGAKSWAESFQIQNPTLVLATGFTNPVPGYSCVPTPGITLGCPTLGYSAEITSYKYIYNYTLTSVGSATGAEQSTINESGTFIIYVAGTPASSLEAFSIFGAYVANWSPCTLGWLVPGTMTGTMFTNGSWGFGPGGTYIFTDPVGQADADASYWVNGGCTQSPASSYTAGGQTVAPQFQDGFAVSQAKITQPANSFSQQWAALDGAGCGEDSTTCGGTVASPAPTAAQMAKYLQNINQQAYPTSGPTPGVYLDYQNINGTPTVAGGGLYVEGNASMVLTAQTASNGDLQQVFTITTADGKTTTITVDPSANNGTGSTVLQSGGTKLSLTGVPANCAATGTSTNLTATPPTYCTSSTSGSTPATMIYVDGTISSMAGPGEGVGAIQDGASVTIAALGDINITGDVVYKTEPVTTTPNQIPGAPVATLIPGNDHNQDLGIFTSSGSIYLSTSYKDDNLQVDGAQAVIGNNCAASSCGFYVGNSCPGGHCAGWPAGGNYQGSCINTFNNVGGQMQTNIFGACLNVENTYFDRRYTSRPGFAPAWFPATTITNTAASTTTPPTLTMQRTAWVASSGQ